MLGSRVNALLALCAYLTLTLSDTHPDHTFTRVSFHSNLDGPYHDLESLSNGPCAWDLLQCRLHARKHTYQRFIKSFSDLIMHMHCGVVVEFFLQAQDPKQSTAWRAVWAFVCLALQSSLLLMQILLVPRVVYMAMISPIQNIH